MVPDYGAGPMKITADAWKAELERVMRRDGGDGMTAQEIQEATGMSRHITSIRLAALHRAGRLKNDWAQREGKDGIVRRVPVYVIVKEKKK